MRSPFPCSVLVDPLNLGWLRFYVERILGLVESVVDRKTLLGLLVSVRVLGRHGASITLPDDDPITDETLEDFRLSKHLDCLIQIHGTRNLYESTFSRPGIGLDSKGLRH